MKEIKIVRMFPDGSIGIECGFCKGAGAHPASDLNEEAYINEICPVCKGQGFNLFHENQFNIVNCKYCDNSGKDRNEDNLFVGDICPACRGKGVLLASKVNGDVDNFWRLIHPKIEAVAKSRFESGHYADSVEASFKEINKIVKGVVKKKTGREFDGADLMNRAFSSSDPLIRLDDLSNENGKNTQKGYMLIFSGSMTGIRNPKAHANIVINKKRAVHFIFLASLLMSKIDEAIR